MLNNNKRSKFMFLGISLLIILGFIVSVYFGTQNQFARLDEDINLEFAQYDSELKARADKIYNLVETVKGYTGHEEAVFTEIAESRAKIKQISKNNPVEKNIEEANKNSENLESGLARLLVIQESYPELKSDKLYISLMDEIAGTENRINYQRRIVNKNIAEYNKTIRMFPSSIYASLGGYEQKPYIEVTEKDKETPKVNFSKSKE